MTQWCFKNPDGSFQEQTFKSCEAAISELLHRTSKDTYEELLELGFILCRVRITMEQLAELK